MVKAAQSGKRANAVSTGITDRYWPTPWRIFRESQMGPILVVVTDILRNQPFQMPLVQDDDMIQQVSATASHPALGNAVLPRTAKGSAHRLAAHAFRKGHYFLAEFCIAVEDQELAGAEQANHPADEVPKRGDHSEILSPCRISALCKSFISRRRKVLMRHSVNHQSRVTFVRDQSGRVTEERVFSPADGRGFSAKKIK